jgi:hypothetical protein
LVGYSGGSERSLHHVLEQSAEAAELWWTWDA